MRNAGVVVLLAGLSLVAPPWSAAQDAERQGSGSGSGSGTGAASTSVSMSPPQATVTPKPRPAEPEQSGVRFVRTLTNVQIEVTITDQTGAGAPEKKTVTMVVSSGSWGKIRSAGNVRPGPDTPPAVVELNVDARPFVSVDGPIQMELTLVYRPLGSATDDTARGRPLPLNQSLTVILQSGKPLVVSQAADPLNDRKIGVEVKATVLK